MTDEIGEGMALGWCEHPRSLSKKRPAKRIMNRHMKQMRKSMITYEIEADSPEEMLKELGRRIMEEGKND